MYNNIINNNYYLTNLYIYFLKPQNCKTLIFRSWKNDNECAHRKIRTLLPPKFSERLLNPHSLRDLFYDRTIRIKKNTIKSHSACIFFAKTNSFDFFLVEIRSIMVGDHKFAFGIHT